MKRLVLLLLGHVVVTGRPPWEVMEMPFTGAQEQIDLQSTVLDAHRHGLLLGGGEASWQRVDVPETREAREKLLPPEGVNLYDVLRHPHLVLTKDAVGALQSRLQKG